MTAPTPDLRAVATRAMTAAMCPGTRVVWAEVVDAVMAAVAAELRAEADRLQALTNCPEEPIWVRVGEPTTAGAVVGMRMAAHLLHPTDETNPDQEPETEADRQRAFADGVAAWRSRRAGRVRDGDAPPGGPAVPPAAEQAESVPEVTPARYRVGRKLRRTLYRDGQYIGIMDTPEDAALVVDALVGRDELVAYFDGRWAELLAERFRLADDLETERGLSKDFAARADRLHERARRAEVERDEARKCAEQAEDELRRLAGTGVPPWDGTGLLSDHVRRAHGSGPGAQPTPADRPTCPECAPGAANPHSDPDHNHVHLVPYGYLVYVPDPTTRDWLEEIRADAYRAGHTAGLTAPRHPGWTRLRPPGGGEPIQGPDEPGYFEAPPETDRG